MQKFLTLCTLFMTILLLLGGLFYKDNVVMWLASTSEFYVVLRGCLAAVLLSLLISNPPRSLHARIFYGFLAVTISSVSLGLTYINIMSFFDTFVFLSASVLFAIASLEVNTDKGSRTIEVDDENGDSTYHVPVTTH